MRRPGPIAAVSARGPAARRPAVPRHQVHLRRRHRAARGQDQPPGGHGAQGASSRPGAANPINIAADSAPTRRDARLRPRPGRAARRRRRRPRRSGIDAETSLIQVFPREPRALRREPGAGARRPRPRDVVHARCAGGQTADFVDLKESLVRHLPLALLIVAAATHRGPVPDDRLGGAADQGAADERADAERDVRAARADLPGRAVRGPARLHEPGRARGDACPCCCSRWRSGCRPTTACSCSRASRRRATPGASDSESVAIGLERTGRIVTAAALLFSIAIGAFATSEIIFIKENGVGTALAVLIDATIIRALLVPSLMELLGKWNWWAPRPLRRLHARFGISEAARQVASPGVKPKTRSFRHEGFKLVYDEYGSRRPGRDPLARACCSRARCTGRWPQTLADARLPRGVHRPARPRRLRPPAGDVALLDAAVRRPGARPDGPPGAGEGRAGRHLAGRQHHARGRAPPTRTACRAC